MELLHSTKMNPIDKSEINFDVSYDSIQVKISYKMHVYTFEADFMHAIAFVINFSIFRELYISQINSK
jgi:UDP-3-O-acyl-N-acetylglucosamine deacetylase